MRTLRVRTAAILLAASVGLSGCMVGPYGGVGLGASYGDPYYDRYYDRYGYGYGPYGGYGSPYGYSPYYGWNNGYYYPGSGYYVYDRYRNPYYWSEAQRRYWEERMRRYRERNPSNDGFGAVWTDFVHERFGTTDGSTQPQTQRIVTQRVTSGRQTDEVRIEPRRERRSSGLRVEQRLEDSEPRQERRSWRHRPQQAEPPQE